MLPAELLISTRVVMFIKNFLRLIIRIILVFNCFLAFSQASGNTPDYHVFIENGKQGVMDKDNSIIIPAEYDKIGWSDSGFEIQSGVLGYSINDQWGLINTNNKIITPPKFEELSIVNTGIYIKAGKLNLGAAKSFFGLISSKGETVIEFHYSNL